MFWFWLCRRIRRKASSTPIPYSLARTPLLARSTPGCRAPLQLLGAFSGFGQLRRAGIGSC